MTSHENKEYNVENQKHCIGGGGEVRQVKLCPRLACAQKRQKCKFV